MKRKNKERRRAVKNMNRKPAGHITVIRTQDEIMFVDDLNPDIISVHPSNTKHSDETEEEYLERLYNDKPDILYWIKKWKEHGLY